MSNIHPNLLEMVRALINLNPTISNTELFDKLKPWFEDYGDSLLRLKINEYRGRILKSK